MAGRIIYLEVDDEITTAAARIRDASPTRIAVVLPYNSRVATSRINFRLLSRDALTHDKRLSIVTADPAARALAASAGLSVFASVAEYDSALVGVEEEDVDGSADAGPGPTVPATTARTPPEPPARRQGQAKKPEPGPERKPDRGSVLPAAAAAVSTIEPEDTIRTAVPREPAAGSGRRPAGPTAVPAGVARSDPSREPDEHRRSRLPWLIGAAILALAILVGGVGAYVLLPSATVVVTPRADRVGPNQLTIIADTTASQPDPVAGVVPAAEITIPIEVSDTFSATGTRVELSKATGIVRFQNLDPTSANRIAAGSIVRTQSGVRFRTDATITVPQADLVGFTIFPSRGSVRVTAVDGGPDGNVDAGTIVEVPNGKSSIFLKVANPAVTDGGVREEFSRVTQDDIDGALAALNLKIQQAFREAMDDPSLATNGATVFPSSGRLGSTTTNVDPATLLGQEVTTFAVAMSVTGTVVAVDPTPVGEIAETQLRAAVETGKQLVADSVDIVIGEAVVVGQSIRFPVTATAEQVAILDADQLKAQILGRSVADARSILEAYGQVDLSVSPDWTGSVPGFENRVTVTIDQAVPVETPAP
ncbi:MAG: baseplate J/gp47 family protein [Chloroflexi bacterium]|nr:baseplate J/gp47 family protein [Chloroflexota bacterium]